MNYPIEETPLRLKSDKLILEQLPDELMIFDPDRNKAFCLNQTAAFVWRHCDGQTTVSEMTELLSEDWGKSVDEQVIRFALDILAKDGLLTPTALPAASGVTRRALLRKMGTGAAMAVPLVTVLFVHPAKAHASSMAPPATSPNSEFSKQGSNGGFWAWLERVF